MQFDVRGLSVVDDAVHKKFNRIVPPRAYTVNHAVDCGVGSIRPVNMNVFPKAVRAGCDNGSFAVYSREVSRPRSIDETIHRAVRKAIFAVLCDAVCDPIAQGCAFNFNSVPWATSDVLGDTILDRAVPAIA
jgi:hypothetical protein